MYPIVCSYFTVVTIDRIRISFNFNTKTFFFFLITIAVLGSSFFRDNIFTFASQRYKQFCFVVNVCFFGFVQIRSNFHHYVCSHKPIHFGRIKTLCAVRSYYYDYYLERLFFFLFFFLFSIVFVLVFPSTMMVSSFFRIVYRCEMVVHGYRHSM